MSSWAIMFKIVMLNQTLIFHLLCYPKSYLTIPKIKLYLLFIKIKSKLHHSDCYYV